MTMAKPGRKSIASGQQGASDDVDLAEEPNAAGLFSLTWTTPKPFPAREAFHWPVFFVVVVFSDSYVPVRDDDLRLLR